MNTNGTEYINKTELLKFIEDIKCDDKIPKNYGTLLDIMRYIRKMPTIQYNNEWISCKDKLPEDCGDVLCTTRYKGNAVISVLTLWYNADCKKWFDCDDTEIFNGVEILAWQPLPEPYKEESEE